MFMTTKIKARIKEMLVTGHFYSKLSLKGVVISIVSLIVSAKLIVPFFPVNFTMQPVMISINVLLFGGSNALAGLLAYIGMGAFGAPVFTQGAGLAYLLSGVTTGFLIGMIISTIIQSVNFGTPLLRHLLGTTILYICGITSWMIIGLDPMVISYYIPSECLKALMFAGLIRLTKKASY